MTRFFRIHRRAHLRLIAALASGVLLSGGCLDSEIVKRFRDAYAPGLIQGLSTAFATPGQAEEGFRQMGSALADGLGAIFQTRTPASSGSGSSSTRSGG